MVRLPFILAAVALAILIACGSDPTATPKPEVDPGPTATTAPAETEQATSEPAAETEAPTEAAPARMTAADIPPCEGSTGGTVGDCAPEFMGNPGMDQQRAADPGWSARKRGAD